MARGLLHGATVTIIVAWVSLLFAMFSPMWLVLRTELEQKQCWYGEGIWTSRSFWGSDLNLASIECKDPFNIGPLSTTRAYCEDDSPFIWKHDKKDYNSKMCQTTNKAKVTSVLASIAGGVSVFMCLLLIVIGGPKRSPRLIKLPFELTKAKESILILIALGSSVATIVFTFVTTGIMLDSPLFSVSHRHAISQTQVGLPFSTLASCSFQTPLHSVFTIFRSGPMQCLFPGPSFFTVLIIIICQGLGCGFLLHMLWDAWVRESKMSLFNIPLLSRNERYDSVEEEGDNAPISFRTARRYSLYGAFARRFSKLRPVPRFCVLTLVPFIFMVGNTVAWAAYSLLGIQIIVSAKMTIINNSVLMEREDNSSMTFLDPSFIPQSMLDSFVSLLQDRDDGILQTDTMLGSGNKDIEFFTDVMNVFNFSPITTLGYFWQSKAYIIAIAVFFSILVIPILKVVCWIWFFYAPSDEILRGRVLDILDVIGKYTLANLYVLCFIAVALCFNSDFIVLPLGNGRSFLFKVRGSLNAGNGVGSYMYVLTSVLSLLIGQYMVQVHAYASVWEEDRRARIGLGQASNVDVTDDDRMLSSLDSPYYQLNDTPYLDGAMSALGFRSSSHPSDMVLQSRGSEQRLAPQNSLEILPTFRSLANFGSVVDLQGLRNQETSSVPHGLSNVGNRQQPQVMRALASFGSRTALNVLAEREARNREVRFRESTIDEDGQEEDQVPAADYEEAHTGSSKGQLSAPIHPYVEAMCDRVHSPLQGTRLKWTPCGKIFIWILIFILCGFVLVCQSWDLVEIHKMGVTGDLVVKPADRYRYYSLISFTGSVAQTGYEVPALELSFLFFFMTAFMPCLTILGLAMMWTIPLTLEQQVLLFNFLEVASAWSSLDIFFISLVAIYIELTHVTDQIISDAVPQLSKLIEIILPFEHGALSAEMKIRDGFWVLLIAVILEKIAIYLITEQAVTAISERRAEKFLRDLARQTAGLHGNESGSGRVKIDTGLLGDAAEGLLETEAMLVFAPMGRYASAMFPRAVYAGLPRSWWVRFGVRTGLLADANVVSAYYETGGWFSLDESEVPRKETPAMTPLITVDQIDNAFEAPTTAEVALAGAEKTLLTEQEEGNTGSKKVSWAELDEENDNDIHAKYSFNGEDEGPISF